MSILFTAMALLGPNAVLANSHISPILVQAEEGGTAGTGGGDPYVADFNSIARNIIYPWLKMNSSRLIPSVDPELFIQIVKNLMLQKKIISTEQVYTNCDGSTNGNKVEACFSSQTGMIYISRRGDVQYQLSYDKLPSKIVLIAHEIFRVMGLEGNNYSISNQINYQKFESSYLTPVCEDTINTRLKWVQAESLELFRLEQILTESCPLYKNGFMQCEHENMRLILRRYLLDQLSSCPANK